MPKDQVVDVNGVNLAIRVWAGPDTGQLPVVLLPATGKTAEDWDAVASWLSSTRTVFAVSLRGHGMSSWTGTYSIQLMADDVVAWLEAGHAGRQVDLVGHSLGGLVACLVANRCPDRVRRLVLEDVGLLQPRLADPPVRPEGALEFDWQVVEQVRPEIDDFDPAWRGTVAVIAAPVLVIAGGATSPVPPDQIADLVACVPMAQMVTIDAGHLVHTTVPERFNTEVLNFLT